MRSTAVTLLAALVCFCGCDDDDEVAANDGRTIDARTVCWGAVERFRPAGPAAVDVGELTLVETGGGPVCGRTDEGMRCFGNMDTGFDESRTLAPIDGAPADATTVVFGTLHGCSIREDRRVKCWGANLVGQLGVGRSPDPNTPVAIRVEDGELVDPLPIEAATARAGPPETLDDSVTGLTDVVQLAAGSSHTCARLESGGVRCWGAGSHGELGDGGNESSDHPVAVEGLDDAVDVSAAQGWTCAVRRGGSVVCWGTRDLYPRGAAVPRTSVPAPVEGLTDIAEIELRMEGASSSDTLGFARTRTGEVVRFGAVVQPVTLPDAGAAVELSVGAHHTCARLDTGEVHCWGSNAKRQLGDEEAQAASTIPHVDSATGIASGRFFTCATRGG